MAAKDSTPIGARFGFLTVDSQPFRREGKQRHYFVSCKCDCGAMCERRALELVRGDTVSCGCQMLKGRPPVHGHANPYDKAYATWNRMRSRCENPKVGCYADYGGRGISVCDRWKSFEHFYADMGDPPPGMSLDRFPDVNGNYEPGNVRWATPKEQANNRRSSRFLEFQGERLTISQWANRLGVSVQTLWNRVNREWPIERILDPRVRPRVKRQ